MSKTGQGHGKECECFSRRADPRTATLYAPSSRRKANDDGRVAIAILFGAWGCFLAGAIIKTVIAIGQSAGWL